MNNGGYNSTIMSRCPNKSACSTSRKDSAIKFMNAESRLLCEMFLAMSNDGCCGAGNIISASNKIRFYLLPTRSHTYRK